MKEFILNYTNIKYLLKGVNVRIKWDNIKKFEDIKYEKGLDDAEGINKITINRPNVRNAFRPKTVFELKEAFSDTDLGTFKVNISAGKNFKEMKKLSL